MPGQRNKSETSEIARFACNAVLKNGNFTVYGNYWHEAGRRNLMPVLQIIKNVPKMVFFEISPSRNQFLKIMHKNRFLKKEPKI